MKTRKSVIPKKDSEFDVVQEVISAKATANISQWRLDQQWMTDKFIPSSQLWRLAWGSYKDPMTRTSLITYEKNEARRKYEPLLSFLVQNMEYSTYISDDELAEMGIYRKSSTHVPSPIPKFAPGYKTSSRGHRNLEFDFFNAETGKKGKPRGVHGAEFRWAILDVPPTDVEELIHSSFDTRTPFLLDFKESERGKTVYFCLRWENTRGEKGPWSDISNTIIP
jgi:hypothetical protein